MPRRNALVDQVIQVSRPDTRVPAAAGARSFVEVSFSGGRSGLLDTSHRGRVWAEVLESLRTSREPAYVEIDPETNEITELLQPFRYIVTRVSPAQEGLLVELAISHARHILRRDHPEFRQLRGVLTGAQKAGAPVYVVENDAHEIVEARPAPESATPSSPTKRGR